MSTTVNIGACACCGGGTCCNPNGGCNTGGPGPGCTPTGAPGDDGCFCDSLCYTQCFDCCGQDAVTCCTPSPEIESLWDESGGHGLQRLLLATLGSNMAEYAATEDDAWGAAMQSGSGQDGYYVTTGVGRISLILCLQDITNGQDPWVAIAAHQQRVRTAATQMRQAAA